MSSKRLHADYALIGNRRGATGDDALELTSSDDDDADSGAGRSDTDVARGQQLIGASGFRGVPSLPASGTYTVYDLIPLIITRRDEVPLALENDRFVQDRRYVKVKFRSPDVPPNSQVWAGNVTLSVGQQELQSVIKDFGLPVRGAIDRNGILPTAERRNRISRLGAPSEKLQSRGILPVKRPDGSVEIDPVRPTVRSGARTLAPGAVAATRPSASSIGGENDEKIEKQFNVGVAPRSQDNFYNQSGAPRLFPGVFTIDGSQYNANEPVVVLEKGNRYRFSVNVGTSHRFYFSLEQGLGGQYPPTDIVPDAQIDLRVVSGEGFTRLDDSSSTVIWNAVVDITIDDDFGAFIAYNCAVAGHIAMGGLMPVVNSAQRQFIESALCSQCSSAPASNACARCHRAFYCSRECQRRQWPSHRKQCKHAD